MSVSDRIHTANILLVDDDQINILIVTKILRKEGYLNIHSTTDPCQVRHLYQQIRPDVLLLDIHMPTLTGFDVMAQLQQDYADDYLPLLILTADKGNDVLSLALASGAKDFVSKPFEHIELLLRVRNIIETHLLHQALQSQNEQLEEKVKLRTQQLYDTQITLMQCLGRAAEFKDTDTGIHVMRISETCRLVAQQMHMEEKQVEILAHASPMHDIGKIGIPDKVLLKPGKLEAEEWEIMKTHAQLGSEILSNSESELLTEAASIAKTHHERWDGTGYPDGLKEEQIPLSSRIVSVCDVFDALTSRRPYKEAWPSAEALTFLKDNAGTQFDPTIVHEFELVLPQILAVRERYPDPVPITHH